jgi:hypothetical protein
LDCIEKRYEYIENAINVRIESLKMELDNNTDQLINKIINLFKKKPSNQKPTKRRLIIKLSEHKRNKKLKLNSKKIGFISLQDNKKIEADVWKSGNIEELVQKICQNCI